MSIKFFGDLEHLLNQHDVSIQEKQDIMNDYKQMYEDGERKGLSENEILNMLGSPEKIVAELGYKKKDNFPSGETIIALSPFISFIIFMILGLTKNLWHPGWMVFLLIPVVAIIIEMGKNKEQYILTALSPFIAITFFLLFGFLRGIWHPTWMIFIIIPVLGIIESKKEMDNLTFLTALSPFISIIAFIFVSIYTGAYQFTWLFFLLVILLGIFHIDKTRDKFLLFISLILSVAIYLTIGFYYGNWMIGALGFILFIIAGILTDFIDFDIHGMEKKSDRFIVLLSVSLFLGVGYFFNLWILSWLFLLIIPMAMIIKYRDNYKLLTPLSPFISVILFFLLGYFYDLWYISWISFILIPIVAILENTK